MLFQFYASNRTLAGALHYFSTGGGPMNRTLLSAMLFVSIGIAADQAKKPPAASDMQRAIQWERHKEAAAARQARLEARHPSVTYTNSADRSVPSAPDPGEPQVRKEKEKEKDQ
jgi:hypothetical protein